MERTGAPRGPAIVRPRARRACLTRGVLGPHWQDEAQQGRAGVGESMGGSSSAFTVPKAREIESQPLAPDGDVPPTTGTSGEVCSWVFVGSALSRQSSWSIYSGRGAASGRPSDAAVSCRPGSLACRSAKRGRSGVLHKHGGAGGAAWMLSQTFHMPIQEAAKHLGVGTTTLKKICRAHGVGRWPFRALRAGQAHLLWGPTHGAACTPSA